MPRLIPRAVKAKLVPFVVVAAVVCVSSLLQPFSTTAQSVPGSARTAPRASVNHAAKRGADARAITDAELQGLLKRDGSHPLLVNYWATWCDPCRDEFPDLVKIDEQYRTKGLDFIAITLDDLADINTAVPRFLAEMKATKSKQWTGIGAALCRLRFFITTKAKWFTNTLAASKWMSCAPRLKK